MHPLTIPQERVALTPTGWSRADLHVHTNLSDGLASPEQVVAEALRHDLRVIAVTDHDTLEGARRVAEVAAERGVPLQVIIGTEVTTRSGHCIGLFLNHRIKMYRSVEYSIDAIKDQGGLVVVPHPLGRLVASLSRRKIDELRNRDAPIDGIEIYNPSPANAAFRQEVIAFNREWDYAQVGSSDAHFWQHIGAAYTLFEGSTAEELRRALEQRTTRSGGQELKPTSLPIPAYIGQCLWAMGVDPFRRAWRAWHDPV